MQNNETIVSVATAVGNGAIAMIRVSGNEAIEIIDKIFVPKSGKPLSLVKSHTIHYGHLVHANGNNVIEEVLVTVMRAPKTFTCEDVVEVNCHGGIYGVNYVMQMILQCGARLAEPGEFTKRAFLNGRIDLTQAEAVADIINAKTERAIKGALNQLNGNFSGRIVEIRDDLLDIMAKIEVAIDYPEYEDAGSIARNTMCHKFNLILLELKEILNRSNEGSILRDGLVTAIIGRPNVGKSSLLNMLVGTDKAIVTNIPGTTRDIVEDYVSLAGIPLRLLDTAGIRSTSDIVEQYGVKKSKKIIEEADLILLVFDGNTDFCKADLEVLELVSKSKVIIIMNKTDLPYKKNLPTSCKEKYPVIQMSTLYNKGLANLENEVTNLFFTNSINANKLEDSYLTNVRQQELLKKAIEAINDALNATIKDIPVDLIQMDLLRTWETLGEIVGENVSGKLIDELFSKFCLGK